MIINKLLATSLIILSANLVLLPAVSAQTTEESTATENTEQLEIIDNSLEIECITGVEYDALTEQQKVDQELPLCDEYEISTEELAAEGYEQETTTEQATEIEVCIPPLDYDSMTSAERAAIDAPLCDE
ncbi:MAG: hypothetical protein V7749_16030 [Cocleimonas sp.]